MCHNALFGTGLSVEDRTADRDETESMMHMKQSCDLFLTPKMHTFRYSSQSYCGILALFIINFSS